jgi:hypothetical protein
MINIERPIGYWLKKLDRLIDDHFDLQLSNAGLTRRQWQLLNLLENDPRSVPDWRPNSNPSCRMQKAI